MIQLLVTLQETGKAARSFYFLTTRDQKNNAEQSVRVEEGLLTKVHHEHNGCEDVDSELETGK